MLKWVKWLEDTSIKMESLNLNTLIDSDIERRILCDFIKNAPYKGPALLSIRGKVGKTTLCRLLQAALAANEEGELKMKEIQAPEGQGVIKRRKLYSSDEVDRTLIPFFFGRLYFIEDKNLYIEELRYEGPRVGFTGFSNKLTITTASPKEEKAMRFTKEDLDETRAMLSNDHNMSCWLA